MWSFLSLSASTSITCLWNCSTLQGLQIFGKATIQGQRGGGGTGRLGVVSLQYVPMTHQPFLG